MDQGSGWVTGLDLGDKESVYCVIDEDGDLLDEGRLRSTPAAMREHFKALPPMRVVLEVGPSSRWVSALLVELGHEGIVANARRVKLISEGHRKSDRVDAELLARLGRADPELLSPIQHRGGDSQAARGLVKSRAALVASRTQLINHVRGVVKTTGERLRSCSTHTFHRLVDEIPEELAPSLAPVMAMIEMLNRQIDVFDELIEHACGLAFPETACLQQVNGVGPVTALTYVTTLEDPGRFETSRSVGAYVGLVPRRDQSGEVDKQLRITKAGDPFLRSLLVNAAHHILGPFGQDSDLRRWGLKLCERGGKAAKKRAVVAVARKLAVLLHRLWRTGEDYVPLLNADRAQPQAG